MVDIEELRERVLRFNSLRLSGQPQFMHMGTSYLVSDLLTALEDQLTKQSTHKMKRGLRPCDWKDEATTKKRPEQGIGFNEWSVIVSPPKVTISNLTTTFCIPMSKFKAFAEWYLKENKNESEST